MRIPKYFYYRVRVINKGTGVEVEDASDVDVAEVVRCRDCKWWSEDDNDAYGYCMAMKHGYVSANWEIGIYRKYKGDFYCADGERIEDEVE